MGDEPAPVPLAEAGGGLSSAIARPARDPMTYGLWVLLPALVAIVLAVFTRQVVPALVVAVVVGAYMYWPCLPSDSPYTTGGPVVGGFRLAVERYVLGSIYDDANDFGHVQIIVFTLLIGFMVGVIARNGGTAGLVGLVLGHTESPRRGALTAWLAGLVVFFDDYASTMIVGPTMRSVFDRLKISRAKLAYIVDSTAAPVASLAIIGTWIGLEIGYIQTGINAVTAGPRPPSFLMLETPDQAPQAITGMQAFLYSLPYRFYPILALFLVLVVSLTGRDFGPMRRAQQRALRGEEDFTPDLEHREAHGLNVTPRWWLGLLPVLALVGTTIAVLWATGYRAVGGSEFFTRDVPWWESVIDVLRKCDPYRSILYGACLAGLTAILLTVVARACPLREAFDAGSNGMARMFPAIVILVLAWALSAVSKDLQLGQVLAEVLKEAQFQPRWLPLAVFACAAVISFATGTSWGTMGILCPVTVEVGARLIPEANLPDPEARQLFYGAVGSVLAGAVFGDHCSPISDTTVLSSIASGCRHEDHVWTQLPYAVLTAVVAMGCGDILSDVLNQPSYVGLGVGALLLLLIVFIFGRRPTPPPVAPAPPAPAPSPAPPSGPLPPYRPRSDWSAPRE
ncbi:MAG TPA: Na+/H+ antiporter NhaC family protein [Phycisphaerae bacterium]|nr:Na+/H+ antiporter NhaC family protein [Phycisphaerae bacterium]HNU44904.1 Na+/H+ antiporter NhaC family protein [Phycisphaerae bacterium]